MLYNVQNDIKGVFLFDIIRSYCSYWLLTKFVVVLTKSENMKYENFIPSNEIIYMPLFILKNQM